MFMSHVRSLKYLIANFYSSCERLIQLIWCRGRINPEFRAMLNVKGDLATLLPIVNFHEIGCGVMETLISAKYFDESES